MSDTIISGNINSLEKAKFIRDGDLIKVRTTATGTFTPSGLSTDFKTTTLLVGDTETALPTTPIVGRVSISIRNLSSSNSVYIGLTGVTAGDGISTTNGWNLDPNSSFNMDLAADIVIYGICTGGNTAIVKIAEVS